MSLKWKSCKIGDVVSVRRGASPRPIKDYVSETGMPWVKIADATKDQTRFINFTNEFIKEEGIEKSVVVNPGDLIVSNSATPGLPKFMNIKACVHDGWLVFDSYNGILKDFLYYYFIVIRGQLVNQANGSVFKNLKTDIVRNFDINLPDLETQKKIVKILSQIDKKIEINIEINKNLEQYLFYIFDETFMNFEFNEFSNSHDKIPQSWNLGTFNDIIDTLGSGDWGKDELTGNYTKEVYCIRGADIPDVKQGNKGKMPIRYILPKNFENKKLNENNIILEISGGSPTQSTGRTVFITEDFLNRFDKDLICTNFCKIIKPVSNYEIFIYLYFNYLYDKDVMFAYENGTTGIKNFDIKSFINNFLIVIPSQEDVTNFNKLVKDVFDIIMHNGLEIEKLQKLRDTLLPKLMSGEIDVSKINCDLE